MNASACDLLTHSYDIYLLKRIIYIITRNRNITPRNRNPCKTTVSQPEPPGTFSDCPITLTAGFILGTPAEQRLAAIAAGCASVVVCRASPSQKAAVVRMMMQYELATAQAGKRSSLGRWLARYRKRMDYKMLAIGDGEA